MAASVEYRLEEMSSGETTEKEKSEDLLSLLVDFNDNNLNLKLLQNSDQFQETLGSESRNPLMPKTIPITLGQNHPGADDLLNCEDKSTDYDWLLSPPCNPTLSLEMEEENLKSNGESTGPQSRVENPPPRRRPACTNGVKSSSVRRPSPSTMTKPLRSSTPPTSRAMVAATKPKQSITPTSPRPSILPATKSMARSSIPTQRPSNPSVAKSRPPTLKNNPLTETQAPPNSKKSLPETNPKAMPKRSSCSPSRGQVSISNALTKKSLPERPASAPRGRTENNSKAIPKRSSCSPSRGKVSNGYSKGDDDLNPVLMGTKMVERVVNMRKLPPPNHNNNNNTCGKLSASQDNSGFGRTLSKKSFDMALRHLDIRRSMPGNMRAMITKVPTSSVYSVRSESTKPPTTSALDSPHATSSSASSDY